MLPGEGGAEFHHQLSECCPELLGCLIFMSGGAFTGPAKRFIDSVTNPCLQKPLHRSMLLQAVRAANVRRRGSVPQDSPPPEELH